MRELEHSQQFHADEFRSHNGSPERIRTAVTALRGRRPRPLDDGAMYARAKRSDYVSRDPEAVPIGFRGSGARTRTPKNRTRTCRVANYTTPEGGAESLASESLESSTDPSRSPISPQEVDRFEERQTGVATFDHGVHRR